MLYLYKKQTENEIESVKRAGDEWFDEEAEQGVPGEDETGKGAIDERAPRKENEGVLGEENEGEPEHGKSARTKQGEIPESISQRERGAKGQEIGRMAPESASRIRSIEETIQNTLRDKKNLRK